MPVWCPKCGAMLPDGLAICPRCGAQVSKPSAGKTELGTREIAQLTFDILRILLIPVIVILTISFLCYLLFLR